MLFKEGFRFICLFNEEGIISIVIYIIADDGINLWFGGIGKIC